MRRMIMAWALAIAACAVQIRAETTIDPSHPYAYGANTGWLDTRGDVLNGAGIGQLYCTGYVWSANCGWISLGNGPTNGWQYSNASDTDWGVNHDGVGNLYGYAYGANIGWIAFEQSQGQPRLDLSTGKLSGYVYGANVGWISLANPEAYVRTERLSIGPDTDEDGLPDAWEYKYTNTLAALSGLDGADADHDGATDVQEYKADTDPLNPGDRLKILSFSVKGTTNALSWTTHPTRFYRLESTNSLTGGGRVWEDVGGGLIGPPEFSPVATNLTGVIPNRRFYRIEAVVPLSEE